MKKNKWSVGSVEVHGGAEYAWVVDGWGVQFILLELDKAKALVDRRNAKEA
jgi:hypothetical protein